MLTLHKRNFRIDYCLVLNSLSFVTVSDYFRSKVVMIKGEPLKHDFVPHGLHVCQHPLDV